MTEDFRALPDLASGALGGAVVWCNDEFYADAFNLVSPGKPTHDPADFNTKGKIYDGWETRRRRDPARDGDSHGLADWAIVRLATPAVVRGVNVDTSFFRGNFPPFASVEAATMLGHPTLEDLENAQWFTVVEKTGLEGDSANVIAAEPGNQLVTHVRLTIYPDGGVARFRVYGEALPDPRFLGGRIDLGATINGGRITGCSNMFYSSPANVLAPGRAAIMSDGWETARRRDDGNDWLIVDLGAAGVLHNVVIDTLRFVGNAPGWARLTDADTGEELLEYTALLPDSEHRFRIASESVVSRVRLDIYPDGGISRLRINGQVSAAAGEEYGARWLSMLPPDQAKLCDTAEFFE
ncbi:allantoicase [Jatrophihabitans sp. GAS493]|uniref:allantoicase n=1 Tax=Jatrophihabitans sp. GAS493 TaxID=1907575 RepID=UPI000BB91CF9|nr:allantoicase [Jatrophihabitans sp. GAS493]SOD71155.1 allantoicase [Jatrophihabitans sp. GAS493]